ncbi:neuronal regeneration-related protein [Rhineura floridana]|uniref:neuronal regeneration-related protein n=1 Tax=Rhineura floridana TaxID=261503 RepID=UPI002AC85DEF|nr:neuronal regeneration-related protein [Rhineura floridana]
MVPGYGLKAHETTNFLKLSRSGSGPCLHGRPPGNHMYSTLNFYDERKVYHPRFTASQKHIPISHGYGGFLQDNLPIPKEVNRKKKEKSEAPFLTPANGYEHHFTKINYLSSF